MLEVYSVANRNISERKTKLVWTYHSCVDIGLNKCQIIASSSFFSVVTLSWARTDPADRFRVGGRFWPRGPNLPPIFDFLPGFRPLYFEITEFWYLLFYFMFYLVVLGAKTCTLRAFECMAPLDPLDPPLIFTLSAFDYCYLWPAYLLVFMFYMRLLSVWSEDRTKSRYVMYHI